MKELIVISGKGGTGKTSITAALASLASAEKKPPVLVDCDVDAANLHLVTGPKNLETNDFIGGAKAWIDPQRCRGKGTCVDVCRFDAVKADGSGGADTTVRHRVDAYACEGCGLCAEVCPERAITMRPVNSGQWHTAQTRFGPMVHGRLGIAESNSGKLVTLLRTTARDLATEKGLDVILVDGPPGIGCPTIASLTGAGYALVVTEPTLSGFHDMQRAIQLAARFNVATGICINKSDINDEISDRIASWAGEQGLDILARLPYDTTVTRAQAAGKTIIEIGFNRLTQPLTLLWETLGHRLRESAACDLDCTTCLDNRNKTR